MPITLTPPKASHRLARRALGHFLELRQDHELLGQIPPEVFTAKFLQSLPVYVLQIGPRRVKSLTQGAKRVAWLYFIQCDSQTAALEVSVENGQHRHARLHEGALMGTLLDLVKKVRRKRGPNVRDAHVRLLRVYALHFSCLWLHGKSDTLVPVNALPAHLEAGVEYSPEEFLARVNDVAKNLLSLQAKHMSKSKLLRKG
jgi:hypothetical protein